MTPLTVLAVTSEIYPFVKTGGLADVTGALPLALRRHGVHTTTLVPGYPAVMAAISPSDRVLHLREGVKVDVREQQRLPHAGTRDDAASGDQR